MQARKADACVTLKPSVVQLSEVALSGVVVVKNASLTCFVLVPLQIRRSLADSYGDFLCPLASPSTCLLLQRVLEADV